jgi:hypothetical protein
LPDGVAEADWRTVFAGFDGNGQALKRHRVRQKFFLKSDARRVPFVRVRSLDVRLEKRVLNPFFKIQPVYLLFRHLFLLKG